MDHSPILIHQVESVFLKLICDPTAPTPQTTVRPDSPDPPILSIGCACVQVLADLSHLPSVVRRGAQKVGVDAGLLGAGISSPALAAIVHRSYSSHTGPFHHACHSKKSNVESADAFRHPPPFGSLILTPGHASRRINQDYFQESGASPYTISPFFVNLKLVLQYYHVKQQRNHHSTQRSNRRLQRSMSQPCHNFFMGNIMSMIFMMLLNQPL